MNDRIILFLIIGFLFLSHCSTGTHDDENRTYTTINFDSIKVTRKNYSRLQDVGRITKVIKLETTRQSLVGTIYRILIDPSNGDLLVGDYDSRKQVLRFKGNGNFVLAYGKLGEGPGEYDHITGFNIDQKGNLILLTNFKLIKYSKDGTFLTEKRLDFFATDIEVIDDLLYISVARYRRDLRTKRAILVFDSFFNQIDGIGDYDIRLEKYNYSSLDTLTRNKEYLLFSSYYDLELTRYNRKSQVIEHMVVPDYNSILKQTWAKQRFNETDRREIRNRIHRFQITLGLEKGVLLLEVCRAKNVYNLWLLNLDKMETTIFPYSCMIGDFNKNKQDNLFFSLIPGTYKNQVIGVFDSSEEFDRYKHRFPLLKDIHFKTDDNPVIAFFELKI